MVQLRSAVVTALCAVLASTMALSAHAGHLLVEEKPLDGWDVDGQVHALSVMGDTVFVGGEFQTVLGPNGTTAARSNLAAFSVLDGSLLPFRADTNGIVRAIEATAGRLYVGGSFTTIGGSNVPRLARLSPTDGAVVPSFRPAPDGAVHVIVRDGSRLYVGGEFEQMAGASRARAAALSIDDESLIDGFAPVVSSTVHAIAVSPDDATVYLGGLFRTINGVTRRYLGGVRAGDGGTTGVSFSEAAARVRDLDVSDDGSGLFAAVGGGQNSAKAWDVDGDFRWAIQTDGDVQAVEYVDGNVWFGFHDSFQGDYLVKLLVADAVDGTLDPFRPAVNKFWGVRVIEESDGAMIAGGEFTTFNGVTTSGLAILPFSSTPDISPPTTPMGLRTTYVSSTTIRLAWEPSVDARSEVSYRVVRDGASPTNTSATSVTVTGLQPATGYEFRVRAVDGEGNASALSEPLSVVTESPTAGDGRFVDDDQSVFETDIEWLAAQGITFGCNPPENDRFCPDDNVTRGQMAAFLVRFLGLTDGPDSDLFTDDDASVFEGDIDRLGTADVTRGCNPPSNDRFCPDGNVTRGQMAAFLVRALDLTDDGGGNGFVDDDVSVFEGDIARLAAAGITRGGNPPSNDRFCPNNPVTRGQMAAFLHRAATFR